MFPQPTTNMEYRHLGNSGLKVSVVGLGNWVNHDDESGVQEWVKYCLEKGVNYFDTAEAYGFGKAEIALGKAFKALEVPRSKIVVSTKIYIAGPEANDSFQSRKHIIEGLKNSLKRLQLDYVDIVFAHRYDMNTPLEETCRAYNYLIEHGYAFYWGTSEWTACQIMEAYKICEKLNLIKPVCEQCQYNFLERNKMEAEYSDLFKKHKMGATTWSPLFGGVLTGKYINETPQDSRFVTHDKVAVGYIQLYNKSKDDINKKLIALKEIAEKKLECNLATLAVAWVIANTDVSSCILGCSKVSQLDDLFKAIELYKKIDKETMLEIEKILENAPKGETDFMTWKDLPSRRNLILGVEYPPAPVQPAA